MLPKNVSRISGKSDKSQSNQIVITLNSKGIRIRGTQNRKVHLQVIQVNKIYFHIFKWRQHQNFKLKTHYEIRKLWFFTGRISLFHSPYLLKITFEDTEKLGIIMKQYKRFKKNHTKVLPYVTQLLPDVLEFISIYLVLEYFQSRRVFYIWVTQLIQN